MSVYAPIRVSDNWFVGEDRVFDFYITTTPHMKAATTVALAATTIQLLAPLKEALISGDKVRFAAEGEAGVVVTLTADAVVGATSLTVSATTGIIPAHTTGRKVQRGIDTWAKEWVLRAGVEAAAATLTKTTGSGLATTDEPNGVERLTLTDTDTLTLADQGYVHALRRTDDGNEVVLAYGEAVLQKAATR
jgi:hypothetical protein